MGFLENAEVAFGLPSLTHQNALRRVAWAIAKIAAYILDEDILVPNHADRVAWAKAAQRDPMAEATKFIGTVLLNPTIQTDPVGASDADYEYVVNVSINDFAT